MSALSEAQHDVLDHIYSVEGKLHIRAARSDHRKQTLDGLERRGLIKLRQLRGRAPYYELTDGGREALGS